MANSSSGDHAAVIGYLGPGTSSYGYAAALKFIEQLQDAKLDEDRNFILKPLDSHDDLCLAVRHGCDSEGERIHYAVVAIENSIAGFVEESILGVEENAWDGLRIQDEIVLPISSRLIGLREAEEPESIAGRKIYSHSSPLRQCRRLIRNYGLKPEVMNSTSKALERVKASLDPKRSAGDERGALAVVSPQAVEELSQDENPLADLTAEFGFSRTTDEDDKTSVGKKVQALNDGTKGQRVFWIEDAEKNATRFWALGHDPCFLDNSQTKTCYLLNLRVEKHGILQKALACFCLGEEQSWPSLQVIHSAPHPSNMWEYTFLIELSGHKRDRLHEDALNKLLDEKVLISKPICLGSYRNATHNKGVPRELEAGVAASWDATGNIRNWGDVSNDEQSCFQVGIAPPTSEG